MANDDNIDGAAGEVPDWLQAANDIAQQQQQLQQQMQQAQQ